MKIHSPCIKYVENALNVAVKTTSLLILALCILIT